MELTLNATKKANCFEIAIQNIFLEKKKIKKIFKGNEFFL